STVNAATGKKDAAGDIATEAVSGVAAIAVSFEKILTMAVGGAGADDGALAGSATVSKLDQTTIAEIRENAHINLDTIGESDSQSVRVRASDRTDLIGVAGALAFGGTAAGVGVGVDVGVIDKDTQARIRSGAQVQ